MRFTGSAKKQVEKLPQRIKDVLASLVIEISHSGPVRGNWSNYGKLAKNRHHCHLKKGSPTYVAVWEEAEKGVHLVEVIYAGTHEKAPY